MEIPFSSPVLIKNVFNNGFLTFEKLGIAIDNSHLSNIITKLRQLYAESAHSLGRFLSDPSQDCDPRFIGVRSSHPFR